MNYKNDIQRSTSFSLKRGVLGRVPEFYFILLVLLAGYHPPFSISPLALGIIAALLFLSIVKNKAVWTIIASAFMLLNFLMILAMVSEFSEFRTLVIPAQQLLVGGSAFFFLNISVCGALIARYTKQSKKLVFGLLYLSSCGWYGVGSLALSRRFPEHATSDILFYMGLAFLISAVCAGLVLKLWIDRKYIERNALQPAHAPWA